MKHRMSVGAALWVVALVSLAAPGANQAARPAFREGPRPFAASAPELLKLSQDARAWAGDDAELVFLWQDFRHTHDRDGVFSVVRHEIFSVHSEAAVRAMALVNASWQPAYEATPSLRARVIGAAGQVFTLDPRTLTTEKGDSGDDLVLTDDHRLRGPLPGIAVGSVVEVVVEIAGRSSRFAGGALRAQPLPGWVPRFSTRIEVSGPAATPVRHVAQLIDSKPVRREENGRAILRWDLGPRPATDRHEVEGLPPEAPHGPRLLFSTARSWEELARAYSARLAAVPAKEDAAAIATIAAGLSSNARDTAEKIRRALRWMNANIRYTAMVFGESAVIPARPGEVAARRYGDCKDQSLLLIGLLRALGIEAHPALVVAAPGPDLEPALPGLEQFSHMVVQVPGATPLWLDPTTDLLPGELPQAIAGRRALVLAPRPSIVEVPLPRAADSQVTADLTVELDENNEVVTRGTLVLSGPFAADWRGAGKDKESARALADRIEYLLRLEGVALEGAPAAAEDGTVTLRFATAAMAPEYAGNLRKLPVMTGPDAVHAFLPDGFLPDDEDDDDGGGGGGARAARPRRFDYVWTEPLRATVKLQLRAPEGFVANDRVADGSWNAGPTSVRQRVTSDARGRTVTITLDTGPTRIKGAQYETARSTWHELHAEPAVLPSYESEVETLRNAGRLVEALARARALVARHPRSAQQRTFLATVLVQAGLIAAARSEARRAVELDPKHFWAQQILAWTHEFGWMGLRYRGEGFDRQALVRERRKELALRSDAPRAPYELAEALARDAEGRYLEGDEDLVEIVRLAEKAQQLGWKTQAMPLLLDALLAAHRYDELETLARTGTSPREGKYLLAAMAMLRGPAQALRELPSLPDGYGDEDSLVHQAALLLSNARLYDEAAPLLKEAARRLPERAAEIQERLGRRRHEGITLDRRKPEDVVKALKIACRHARTFAAERGRAVGETLLEREPTAPPSYQIVCEVPEGAASKSAVVVDASLAGKLTTTGDTATAFRVEERRAGGAADPGPYRTYLVAADRGGRLQVVATTWAEAGREALRLIERNRLEAAARVVGWGRELLAASAKRIKDGHLARRTETLEAMRSVGAPDAEGLRIAAAVLAGPRFRKISLPVLERAFARAQGPTQAWIGQELMHLLLMEQRHADALQVAARLPPEARARSVVREVELMALARARRKAELEALVAEWRQREPLELVRERLLIELAMDEGRLDDAIARLETLAGQPEPSAFDQNNLAWYLFARGKDLPRAIDLAGQASEQSRRSPSHLHTLATVLAADGRLDEALKLAAELRKGIPPEPTAMAFLLGLLAEKLELPDEARRYYQRASDDARKPRRPDRAVDVASLARARLGRLATATAR